jgi:hypothetical protein
MEKADPNEVLLWEGRREEDGEASVEGLGRQIESELDIHGCAYNKGAWEALRHRRLLKVLLECMRDSDIESMQFIEQEYPIPLLLFYARRSTAQRIADLGIIKIRDRREALQETWADHKMKGYTPEMVHQLSIPFR